MPGHPERSIVDDVRGLMQYTGCLSARGHEPQPTDVASYWLCPHCGLQIHWPCEEQAVAHKPRGEAILERWSKI